MTTSRLKRLTKPDYQVTRPYRASWFLFLVHHLFCIAAGLAGFIIAPSPTVERVVGGELAVALWSSTFIVFGIGGVIARCIKKVRAEAVAVLTIAGARILLMGMMFITIAWGDIGLGSLQTALTLGGGSFFLIAWSITTLVWISGEPFNAPRTSATVLVEIRDQLQTAVDNDPQLKD